MRSTIEKLMDIVDNPMSYMLKKNTLAYEAIGKLVNFKIAHSTRVSGRCANTSINVFTPKVIMVLEKAGIPYRVGNDAPRGGKHGEYVAIDVKSFKPLVYDAEKYNRVIRDGEFVLVKK